MLCPKCGGENRDTYKFCTFCGTPRPDDQPVAGTVIVPESPTVSNYQEVLPPPPPLPPAEVSVPYTPAPAAKPRRKRRGLLTCAIILLILLCVAVVALVAVALLKPEWLPFDIPFLARDNKLIIGVPNADGETDLYLLRLGQKIERGLLLADQVLEAEGDFIYQRQDAIINLSDSPYFFGAFVPQQEYLLYWYGSGDGEITLNRLLLEEKIPVALWEEGADLMWGAVLPNMQDIFLRIERGTEQHCYVSRTGAAADEVLQGAACYLSTDLSTVISKMYEGTQTTANLFTLADNAVFKPLDAQENIGTVDISGDGVRLAYIDLEGTPNVRLVNSQNGSTQTEGPAAYAVVAQGFAERGHVGYFLNETDEGNIELYLMSDSGTSLVRNDLSIGAAINQDGSRLVYMTGAYEGERTLYVRDVASGTDTTLVSGNELRFELANPLNRIFISSMDEGELNVYCANMDGSGLVSLFAGEGYQLGSIYYVPGQPYVFLYLTNEDGTTLLATRPDQADEYLVVENWASVSLLDTSVDGLQLLYAGAEDVDGDASLYLAQLDTKTSLTLDGNAVGIGNALFSSKGDQVVYTALTGSDPNQAEIRRVNTDAVEPPDVLYTGAVLVAAQWDTFQPFLVTTGATLYQGTSYCPGVQGLTLGTALEANMVAGAHDCYRYRGTAEESVTFWIEAVEGLDTSITLYDRQGNLLDSDDYGLNGTDPRLITTFPADGIYFLEIASVPENTGDYTLASVAGMNYCPGVETIALGDTLSGEMDEVGQVFYGLTGAEDDSFTIWVESTDLDPMISLYDHEGTMLGSDDNNLDGVDPLLFTTLPEDGNYCLEVNTFGFETGPYTISMVEGSVFCPSADLIRLGDTVTDSIVSGRRTCYAIEVDARTEYIFLVNSPSETDTLLELYDDSGELLDTDDDSGGYPNPMLLFEPDRGGTYYLVIRGYSDDTTGDYEILFDEAPEFEDAFRNATQLPANQRISGAITAMDMASFPGWDYEGYGDMYYFEGTAGQTIQIDAFADSIGSDLDPSLVLFNSSGTEALAWDDDGGSGYDSQIVIRLPYTGRYYVYIEDWSGDYSSASAFFYEILLSIR